MDDKGNDITNARTEEPEKKRRTWAKAACLLAILWGLTGIIDGAVEVYAAIEEDGVETSTKAYVDVLEQEVEQAKTKTTRSAVEVQQEEVLRQLQQVLQPAWYGEWRLVNASVLIAINVFYILVAVMLLRKKEAALQLFIIAAVTSVVWTFPGATVELLVFEPTDYIWLLDISVAIVFNGALVAMVFSELKKGRSE